MKADQLASRGLFTEHVLEDLVAAEAPICYGIVVPGPHYEGGVYVVKVKDIENGTVRTDDLRQTSPEIERKYSRSRLAEGDILLSIRGTVGRVGVVPAVLAGANITQDTARIRISCSVTRDYVVQILQTDSVQRQIQTHVVGQAVQGINIRDVKRLRLPIPEDVELQKFISEALEANNSAIATIDELIGAKQRLISAQQGRVFSHVSRTARFVRADQLFAAVSEKGRADLEVLSVTQDRGVIPRRMLEKQILMDSNGRGNFKVVRVGDFVISLRSFQGGFEFSPYEGIVSPAYTVLRPRQEVVVEYFRHYLKSSDFLKRLSVAVIGIRDGKQISFSDFASIKLPVPAPDIQRSVALFLDTLVLELSVLRQQRDCMVTQRRGLLRQILFSDDGSHTLAKGVRT